MSDGIPREPTGEYSVDGVRDELRRLGYLDHKVERFLLQDALRPDRPAAALWHLTLKVGALIGAPSALLLAWVLAATNGHLEHRPLDLLPLFLHLLPPLALLPALGFLLLAGVLVFFLRVRHVRRIEGLSFGIALLAAVAAVAVALWQGWTFLPVLPRWQVVALLLAVPFMAWAILEVVHGGLLTLAIRLTDLAPEKPFSHGRWIVLGLVLATFLGMIPAALDAVVGNRGDEAAGAPSLPMSDAGPVVLIGVDGVLGSELDFLLALSASEFASPDGPQGTTSPDVATRGIASRGAADVAGKPGDGLPHLRALLDGGGAVASYRRPAEMVPPAFWTTVATGIPAPLHGMESLDSFRPAGMARPLRRSGWLRPYWSFLSDTGWVEHRPVLSGERSAWTFWELVARAGEGAVSVGWWGTFPARQGAGLTVAHGAYSLLAESPGATPAGAVDPADLADDLRPALEAGATEPSAALVSALRRVGAGELVEKALRPDAFYRHAFELALARRPGSRAAALYLPGLDVAAGLGSPGSVAQAAMVRWQLGEVDALVGRLLQRPAPVGTLVLVADPGRRMAGAPGSQNADGSPRTVEGRIVVVSRTCSREASEPARPAPLETEAFETEGTEWLEPAQIGSLLFRAAGLPQSREIPPPPALCSEPRPPLVVDTFGLRRTPAPGSSPGDEYLRQLRSLGYL